MKKNQMNNEKRDLTTAADSSKRKQILLYALIAAIVVAAAGFLFAGIRGMRQQDAQSLDALPKAVSLAKTNPSPQAESYEETSVEKLDSVIQVVDGKGDAISLDDLSKKEYRGFLFKLSEDVAKDDTVKAKVDRAIEAESVRKIRKDLYEADSLDTIAELFDESELEYIEPDYYMDLIGQIDITGGTTANPAPDYPPTDPEYTAGALWNLDMLNVQGAWEAGLDGDPYVYNGKSLRDDNVRVAVIDTGLYGTGISEVQHEDLDYSKMFSGTNFVTDDEGTPDAHGHGTFVAGLIAAKANNGVGVTGAQPGVEIVSEKVFDTGSASTADVISAIYAAVDEDGADVINMSLGGEYNEQSLETACNYAVSKGVLVVASAGNDGVSTPNYPAAYNSVVGVASVNSAKQRSTWSQYGKSVFVTAPGENVCSTFMGASDAYKTASGTSFSGPEVAALAAMCKSVYPDIDQDTFKQFLIDTSNDLGAKGYDDYYGWGLVDFTKMAESVLASQVMPWYNITFSLTDEDGHAIDTAEAKITLTAAEDISWEADPDNGIDQAGEWAKGTAVSAESDGTYKLHRGNYAYTVVVDGKYTENGTFKTYIENQTAAVKLATAYAVTVETVDSQGNAVAGAAISVSAQNGRVETPKSQLGSTLVYDLASGIYSYEAAASGYEQAAGTFTVQRADKTIQAVLYQANELTTVGFELSDNDGGAAVNGATITVTDASGVSIAPQEDGTWRLAKGATYTADVIKPGFENAKKTFVVEDGTQQTVAISLQRASSRITFNVVDENNHVISSANVKVANEQGEPVDAVPTNPVQFSLSEGDYTYEAAAPGYSVKTGSFGVALDSYTITVVLEAQPSKVTFSVIDDQTEETINNVTIKVNLSDRLRAIEPASPGLYLLEPGTYDYTVFAENYKIGQGQFTVAGEDMTVTVRLSAQTSATGYAGGSGTEDDPYLIANEDQLRYLAAQTELVRVTSTSASTNKKETIEGYFRLTDDIELTGGEWMAIGNYENGSNWAAFGGDFDGGGHTISGLTISGTYDYQGLFGYVRGAHIHDLIVEGDITVNGKSTTSGGSYVGGIVGGVYAANDTLYTSGNVGPTTVERCGSYVDVTGRYAIGGIVGSAQGATPTTGLPDGAPDEAQIIIRDCFNKGNMHAMLNGSYMRTSGTGQVAAGKRAGGIAGSAQYARIENCYNTGDVFTGESTGGIAGYTNLTTITSCYSSGQIMQYSNASGEGGKTGFAAGATVRTNIEHVYGLEREDNYSNDIVGTQGAYTTVSGSTALAHDAMYRTDDFVDSLNENTASDQAEEVFALGHDFPMLYWEVVEGVRPALTPVIIEQPQGIAEENAYVQGSEANALTARIRDIAEEDGTVTWQWFVSDTNRFKDAKPAPKGIGEGAQASYAPSTEEIGAKYYFCVFTNRVGLDLNMSEASVTTHSAVIYVRDVTQAETPEITKMNPGSSTNFNYVLTGKQGTDLELSVTASVTDGGTLSYQWYYSESGSGTGKAISGATDRTYRVNTDNLGTGYYYVEVTNTTGPGNAAKVLSDWIKVTVEPYTISNYQELAAFRTAVNSGNTFFGQIVYLLDDIAIPDDVDWTPIGTTEYPFMGTFMGGTGYAGSDPETVVVHKITNLSINGDNHNNDKLGLFGVASGATICDVQVSGTITGEANTNTGLLIGQIFASGSTASSIENCGTLDGSAVEGAWSVGGLVGYGGGALSNCANHANVHAYVYSGSLGSGTITADSKYAVGGVSGYQSSGNMLGCYNTGAITVDEPNALAGTVCATRVGGVAGATGYYAGAASCYNAGTLDIATVAESQYERGALYVGSVVGYLNSANGVNNYYMEGTWERGADGSDHTEAAELRSSQFMKTGYFTELLNTGTGSYSYNQFRSSANGVPHLVWEDDNVSDDAICSAEPYITKLTSVDFPEIMDTLKGTYFQNTTYIDPIIVWADTPDGGNMRYEWRMREKGADDDAWKVVASGAMTPDEKGKNGQAPVTVDVSEIGTYEYQCEVYNKREDAAAEPFEESMYTPVITITVKDADGVISLRDPNQENSKDNPWVIDSAAKMKFFADIVNGEETYRPITDSTFEGQYIELTEDIDISAYAPWTPVGSNTSSYNPTSGVFKGIFDGKNHTIKGLSIVNPSRNEYNGLFGHTRMATIRNLEIAGEVIMDSASAFGTGGVVGYAYGTFIENVVNRVNVTGAVKTGGIVGYGVTDKLLDCENLGTVTMNEETMASTYGGYDVGGIAGYISIGAGVDGAGVYNCFNNGTVSGGLYDGDYRIGAIVGGTDSFTSEYYAHNYYRAGSIVVDGGTGTGIGGGSYEPVADVAGKCASIRDTNSAKTAYALDTSDSTAKHSKCWGNYIRTDAGDAKPCVHLVRAQADQVIYLVDNTSDAAVITVSGEYAVPGEEVEVSWTNKPGFAVSKVSWRIAGTDELYELGAGDTADAVTFNMPEGDVEFVVESAQDTTYRYSIASELRYNGTAAPAEAGSIAISAANNSQAAAGETVEVTINVAEGYQVKAVSASDAYGGTVSVERKDGLHYSFTMPAADVTVTAVLEDYGAATDIQAPSLKVDGSAIHYRNPDSRYTTADLLYEVMVLSGTAYGIDDPWMTYELERWSNPGLYQQTYSIAGDGMHTYTGLDVAKWLRNRIGEDISANTAVRFEGADGSVYMTTYGELTKLTYNTYDAVGQPEVRGLPVLLYFGIDGVPNTNGAMGIVFGQESPKDDNAAKQITGLKRISVREDISSMQHVYAPYNDFDEICGGTANDKKGFTDLTIRVYRGGTDSKNKGTLVSEKVIGLDEIEAMANEDRSNIHRGYYSASLYEDKDVATANSQYTDYYEGYDLYKLLKEAGVPYEPEGRVQFYQSGLNGLENSWETVEVSLGYLAGNGENGEGDYSGNTMSYSNADDAGSGPTSGTLTNVHPLLLYGKNGLPLVWSSGTTGVGYTNYNYRGPMIAFLPQNANEGGTHVGTKSAFSCYLGLIEVYLDEESGEEADKTGLSKAIEAAYNAENGIHVSADGSDVDPAEQWTTEAQKKALDDAIAAANALANDPAATQKQVDDAITVLEKATETYNQVKQNGTYVDPEIQRVSELIKALPDTDAMKRSDVAKVQEAKTAFDTLSDAQQAEIDEALKTKLLDAVGRAGEILIEAAEIDDLRDKAVVDLAQLNKLADKNLYTAASYKDFEDAYSAFKELVLDEDVTAKQLRSARVAVANAYTKLVVRIDIAGAKITGLKNVNYTGKAQTQTPVVTLGGKQLSKTDYTVSYKNNKNSGTATVVITGGGDNYTGTASATFKINPIAQKMTVKATAKTVKASKVKKKAQSVTVLTVKNAKGAKTYAKVSGSKKLTVNAKTGKITVKKGAKNGIYKCKVKVTAKGNANYKAMTKTVSVTVKVK